MNARGDALVLSAGHQVRDRAVPIAEKAVASEFGRRPDLAHLFGPEARTGALRDAAQHLAYLAEALDTDSPALYLDYVAWARVVLHQRAVGPEALDLHLACLAEALPAHVPPAVVAEAAALIARARAELPHMACTLDSFIDPELPLAPLTHQYLNALLRGERQAASRLVLDAVERGTPVRQIYLQVFQPAQWEIGRLWQLNRISVAQEHYCTAATQLVMSQLYPQIFAGRRRGLTLVVACVAGDLHEIGARMVGDFFEMAGWDTYFCGADTPHASVLKSVVERRADVLGISVTLSPHLHAAQALIAAAREHPGCARLRILVGGYPFKLDPQLWRRLGADGTAHDADAAIEIAEGWAAERAA